MSDCRFLILVVFDVFIFSLKFYFITYFFLLSLLTCLCHSAVECIFILMYFLSITENFEPLHIWVWTLSQLFYYILLELPVNIIQNYSVYLSCFSCHNVLDDYLNSNFLFLFLDYCLSFYFHFSNYIFPFLQFLFYSFSYLLILFYKCYFLQCHSEH